MSYKIRVNIIIIMANCSSLLDGTFHLPHAEEKLIAVVIYLDSSNDQNNLIMRDCPSLPSKRHFLALKAWMNNTDKYQGRDEVTHPTSQRKSVAGCQAAHN